MNDVIMNLNKEFDLFVDELLNWAVEELNQQSSIAYSRNNWK